MNSTIKSRHMKELPVPAEYSALATLMGLNSPIRQWQSRDYLAQLYRDHNGYQRLTVNRVTQTRKGQWDEGITWDELQRIKQETVGDVWAVEVYPTQEDLVNVSNMRHLWILPTRPAYAWHDKEQQQ